ncbi:MAG: Tex-like N-terminal domain-containing protein, partial [Bacteroidota bacterium]
MLQDIEKQIATQLSLKPWQVQAVLKLLSEGATLPFISRYRKEATGNLDEVEVGAIKDLHEKAEQLGKRRTFVLEQIKEQGKLTPELEKALLAATDLQTVEDLYLPYKARRKTRADIAREKGLEPLAKLMMDQKDPRFMQKVSTFLTDVVLTEEDALQGARDIVAEWINEDAPLRSKMRELFAEQGVVYCKNARGKKDVEEAQKYRDYFDFQEPLKRCAGHRFLAMMRGMDQGFLKLSVEPDESRAMSILRRHCLHGYSDASDQVKLAMEDSYGRLLQPSLENELLSAQKEKADEEAISVFATNARQLLLAAPLGEKRVMAID